MRNRKPTGRASTMPGGLLSGTAISLAITLLGAGIAAKLMDSESIGENTVGYAVMVILLLASFLGAIISQRKVKRQYLVVSVLSGVIYFVMLLSITALFFGGQYEAVGVTGLIILGGNLLAFLTGTRPNGGGKRKKIIKGNR